LSYAYVTITTTISNQIPWKIENQMIEEDDDVTSYHAFTGSVNFHFSHDGSNGKVKSYGSLNKLYPTECKDNYSDHDFGNATRNNGYTPILQSRLRNFARVGVITVFTALILIFGLSNNRLSRNSLRSIKELFFEHATNQNELDSPMTFPPTPATMLLEQPLNMPALLIPSPAPTALISSSSSTSLAPTRRYERSTSSPVSTTTTIESNDVLSPITSDISDSSNIVIPQVDQIPEMPDVSDQLIDENNVPDITSGTVSQDLVSDSTDADVGVDTDTTRDDPSDPSNILSPSVTSLSPDAQSDTTDGHDLSPTTTDEIISNPVNDVKVDSTSAINLQQ
jgi:hypothetical protein